MKLVSKNLVALLALLTCIFSVRAQDLISAMNAENVKWLTAFNTNTPATFNTLYAKDAILMPPGLKPITGSSEIAQFWESRLKPGNKKDHTFDVISVAQDVKLAYQINRWSVVFTKDNGERTLLVGNSSRIFELQGDGTWLIKLHIYAGSIVCSAALLSI